MRLRIFLSALTRKHYELEVEVPDDTPKEKWKEIAAKEQKNADGGDYETDYDYWEDQEPEVEKVG